MPNPRSIYTKLTRRHRTLGGYTQLWLGPDHILLLSSTRIAEEYKRFSISDIQSIVVTELPSRLTGQIIAIFIILAWICLRFVVDSSVAKWTFEITGALALLWPIVDMARGAPCRCYLHTRVTNERLEPVSRIKTARKFLALIRPMIGAVQGVLPAEQLEAIETPSSPWKPAPPAIVTAPGYLPELVFGTFLLNAILIWASVQFPKQQEIFGILINTLFAEALLILVALLRRRGRDERLFTYVLIALAIAGVGFDGVTLIREIGGWYMTLIEKAKNKDTSITSIAAFPAGGRRAMIAYSWRAAAGAIGMAMAFYERRRKKVL